MVQRNATMKGQIERPLLIYEKSGGDSVSVENIGMMWDSYVHFQADLPI